MGDKAPIWQGSITAGVLIALFKAILIALQASGVHIGDGAIAAWVDVAEIGFPVAVVAGTGWWVARNTTSLHKPTDVDGVRLSRPGNEPAVKEEQSIRRAIFEERKV